MGEMAAASMIRRYLKIHAPDTILIPSEHERDEHRLAAHEAAVTVVPPQCHVFAYQTRSSTLDFRPNVFAGVQRVMERKVRAGPSMRSAGPRSWRTSIRPWLVRPRAIGAGPRSTPKSSPSPGCRAP